MPDDINNQPQKQNSSGFVTRPVETPILDSQSRATLTLEKSSGGGIKGFYKANKFYFWAILAGILIIGILSYFAFKKAPATAPKDANVSISIDVPDTVPSGGEAVYKITLQNNDSQNLVNLELELTYADGETFDSSSPNPENLSGTLFKVPDLISGQNAVVFVKAKVSGNVNDQKTLDAKLHYHYSNFSSEFIKDQTSTVRLAASNVVIELQGPTTTNNAQLVVYNVNYQNSSDADIANARIKMDYPDGFTFASATPPPDLGTDTWNVSSLAQNASSTIQIQGNFSSVTPGETKTATAEFLILGQDGQYFTQNSSSFNTSISSLPLLVTQALQQSNNSSGIINPGDSLTFTVNYQNNAATAASGVNIEVDLNSKVIDPTSITAQGAQINNNSIIWNASGVPQLANLSPNQSGQLTFSLKINNPATKDSSKNLTLVSNIKMSSNEYSSPFPGAQLSLKVSSPSAIAKSLSFISGQLPPKVGVTTTYKVSFGLTNSSNDFSNGILTAFIPANGLVTGSFNSAETNNVQYDPSTGKLTWNFGSLPANTGRFTAARVLSFQVKLSPSASQAGQSAVLVNQIGFTANDIFTAQNVTASSPDVTTQDLPGSQGYSDGQVTN